MQYITNKNLINKLQDYKKAMDFTDLSNKDHNLTIATINQFTDLIAVNDVDDDINTPFDIPTDTMLDEYDDLIAEIAETCTPKTYSQLTAWLHYHNDHIALIDDYTAIYGFHSIINSLAETITNTLKQDLITILTNITK